MSTDKTLERNGIEFEEGNILLKIARAGGANQSFNKVAAEIGLKRRQQIEANDLDDDEALRIAAELYGRHVVLSWQTEKPDWDGDDADPARWVDGIENANGDIVPDTTENRIAFFIDVPDFLMSVKRVADNYAYYRKAILHEMGKK